MKCPECGVDFKGGQYYSQPAHGGRSTTMRECPAGHKFPEPKKPRKVRKVWMVLWGGEDRTVENVFSTKEKAEAWMKNQDSIWQDYYGVKEFTVDQEAKCGAE
jgi:hypothetical protein